MSVQESEEDRLRQIEDRLVEFEDRLARLERPPARSPAGAEQAEPLLEDPVAWIRNNPVIAGLGFVVILSLVSHLL